VPTDLDVHLILYNYATHKTLAIYRWLARHPRFPLHFTPTGGSWLNLVERWFSELTTKRLRRGTIAQSRPWKRPSAIGAVPRTSRPSPSSGSSPLTRYLPVSLAFAAVSPRQDASAGVTGLAPSNHRAEPAPRLRLRHSD
jgi:hypothetical protein